MHRASQTDQIREGAELFAVNCSPCHGPRMQGSESAFDLRKYPPEQRDRFLNSVTRGKNQMPPWGDTFSPEQLDALWADRRAVNVRVAQTRAETARVIPSFPVLIIFVRYPTRRARCLLPKPARSLSRQCGSPAARRAPCHATSQSMRDAYLSYAGRRRLSGYASAGHAQTPRQPEHDDGESALSAAKGRDQNSAGR
jgi:hypothetical protein